MIRVLLVDDDDLVRPGLSMIIENTEDITVIGEAATGGEAVTEADRLQPDVILMDFQMPDGDGIEATRQILTDRNTTTKIIVVATFEFDKYVFRSLQAGASGHLLKRTRPAELIDGIRLSGGGLRFAAFNLGVLQVLDEREVLGAPDYLAAVSGGNNIASAYLITAAKSDEATLAGGVWQPGSEEERLLRTNSTYLATGGAVRIWLVANYLYGLILNLIPLLWLFGSEGG